MSMASPHTTSVATPLATHARHRDRRPAGEGVDPQSRLLLRRQPCAQGHQPVALRQQGHRLHRPVGLRQVDAAARAEPHVRPLSRPARHRRGAVRRREHARRPARTSTCCARASAWCSRSRRRSRCRSTRTSPSASASTRRLSRAELDERVETALRRAALWDEVKDKLDAKRPRPLGRPAAAPLHRPHRRGEARDHPARRAVLGARSDLDRQDRGADRRAEAGLHDRHRHPQHAAGGARLGLHRLHVSRRAGRVRRDREASSPRRSDKRTQDYITGRFG